jgi:hypothetical protein
MEQIESRTTVVSHQFFMPQVRDVPLDIVNAGLH